MEKHQLSKSTFIRGVQCLKSLYLHKHRPFLRDKLSAEQLAKFNRGHQVGHLAQSLFPDGVDCSPSHPTQYAKALEKTQLCIQDGTEVVYEAVFTYHKVLVMVDILVKTAEGWQAFEVKSSLKISETYILDAALQYYVVEGSGLKLTKQHLITLNPDYIRQGELNLQQLFKKTEITDQCIAKQDFIKEQIEAELQSLGLKNSPAVAIGNHCHEPYPCDFIGHCWKHVSPKSVLYMQSPSPATRFAWHNAGFSEPDVQNTGYGAWASEIQALTTGKPFIIKTDLAEFIDLIQPQLVFLDVVIDRPALPPFEHTAPYEPLISALTFADFDSPSVQSVFFEIDDDKRLAALETLRQLGETSGSIVVWQADELKAALDAMAKFFPETLETMEFVKSKIIDLCSIVQSESVFFPIPNAGKDLQKIGAGLGIASANKALKQPGLAAIARKYNAVSSGYKTPEWEAAIAEFTRLNINTLYELFLLLKSYLA